jgi:hypothetical protein
MQPCDFSPDSQYILIVGNAAVLKIPSNINANSEIIRYDQVFSPYPDKFRVLKEDTRKLNRWRDPVKYCWSNKGSDFLLWDYYGKFLDKPILSHSSDIKHVNTYSEKDETCGTLPKITTSGKYIISLEPHIITLFDLAECKIQQEITAEDQFFICHAMKSDDQKLIVIALDTSQKFMDSSVDVNVYMNTPNGYELQKKIKTTIPRYQFDNSAAIDFCITDEKHNPVDIITWNYNRKSYLLNLESSILKEYQWIDNVSHSLKSSNAIIQYQEQIQEGVLSQKKYTIEVRNLEEQVLNKYVHKIEAGNARFAENPKYLAVGDLHEIVLYQYNKPGIDVKLQFEKDEFVSGLSWSNDGSKLAISISPQDFQKKAAFITIYDPVSENKIEIPLHSNECFATELKFIHNDSLLIVYHGLTIEIIDVFNNKWIAMKNFDSHLINFNSFQKSPLLWFLLRNGMLHFWDFNNDFSFDMQYKNPYEWCRFLPDYGIYQSTKLANSKLYFIDKSMNVIPYHQYDLFYNRPHEVLSVLRQYFPNISQELIYQYKRPFEARLRNMGVSLSEKENDFSAPIVVNTFELQKSDKENTPKNVKVLISAIDSIHYLRNINVIANGVPIYGIEGISLKGKNLHKFDTTLVIPLCETLTNKLQAVAFNEMMFKGLGVRWEHEANSDGPLKTFFIGIGANDFEYCPDLKFCEKDIHDLDTCLRSISINEQFIKRLNSYPDSIKSDVSEEPFGPVNVLIDSSSCCHSTYQSRLLLGHDMNQKSILELNRWLMNNSFPDDQIIVSCSSHGLRDSDGKFYIATPTTDPNNPSLNGLSLDQILTIFNGVPARKRVLILDACYSGISDDEPIDSFKSNNALIADKEVSKSDSLISYQGRSVILDYSSDNSDEDNFNSTDLFDLPSNSGVTIVAAAQSNQKAGEGMEGRKNGNYSHALLWALKSDEKIKVSELGWKVGAIVESLTGKKQKPTIREQNLEFDWELVHPCLEWMRMD